MTPFLLLEYMIAFGVGVFVVLLALGVAIFCTIKIIDRAFEMSFDDKGTK